MLNLCPGNNKHFAILNEQIKEYLRGNENVSISLILKGTAFQEKVWKELLTIPYGVNQVIPERQSMLGILKQ